MVEFVSRAEEGRIVPGQSSVIIVLIRKGVVYISTLLMLD